MLLYVQFDNLLTHTYENLFSLSFFGYKKYTTERTNVSE